MWYNYKMFHMLANEKYMWKIIAIAFAFVMDYWNKSRTFIQYYSASNIRKILERRS